MDRALEPDDPNFASMHVRGQSENLNPRLEIENESGKREGFRRHRLDRDAYEIRSAARFGGVELPDAPICDTCGGSICLERNSQSPRRSSRQPWRAEDEYVVALIGSVSVGMPP